MDRFLDEQESGMMPGSMPGRDRSVSPLNSLIYGDPKRSHFRQEADEASAATTFDPIDPQPVTDINTSNHTTTFMMSGGASGSAVTDLYHGGGGGASGACSAVSEGGDRKRGLDTDKVPELSGNLGSRGDMNGNTEGSETSATEPVLKKFKWDTSEGSGEVCSQQPPVPETKHLETLSVPAVSTMHSIPTCVLKSAEQPTSTDSFRLSTQQTAESVGQ